MKLSSNQIAEWLGLPAVEPAFTVTGITTDSRKVEPGDLFVAIKGEQHDGHVFVPDAFAAGAVAAVTDRAVAGIHFKVADTLDAYGRIANGYRRQLAATVIGITGSSGKTSTKDILAQLLSNFGATVAPPGSFNNEIGMPATILSADSDTNYLVLEMGMRGLGHISYLCDIAEPSIGAILNVGSAHLELLGSVGAILTAKSELVRHLPASGIAVLYADDPAVLALSSEISAPVISFGESAHADVRLGQLELDDRARPGFDLHYKSETARVQLQLAGEHQALNAAAAAAIALAAGLPFKAVCAELSRVQPQSKWRMQVVELAGGITLVNDAYNANPESMRAGLKSLKAMSRGRRTWAVLGEMRELGPDSVRAHDEIGRLCVRLDISRMIGVGSAGKIMQIGAREEGSWGNEAEWVEDVDAAIAKLTAELAPGDIVFVKASRAVGMERVADAIQQAFAGENPLP